MGLVWRLSVIRVTVARSLTHSFQSSLRKRGIGTQRLLIVGTGEPAHLVLERVLHTPGTGYRPVGFVAETSEVSVVHGLPVLGTLDCIGATVAQHQIDDVVVAMPTLSQQRLIELVTQCSNQKVNIKVFPDLFQFMTSGINIGDLNGLPLISVKDVALRGWNVTLKRAMDAIGSAILLVLLSP